MNGVVYYDHEIDGIKKLSSPSNGLKSPSVPQSKKVSCSKEQHKYTNKNLSNKKLGTLVIEINTAQPSENEDEEIKEYNKSLMKAIKRGVKPTDGFTVGHPKCKLVKHIPKYPISLSGRVLIKAVSQKTNHHLNYGNFFNLLDFLSNPIAIFKSKTVPNNGFVVLTEIYDVDKNPVMVALHIKSQFKNIEIASMYVRNNYNTYKTWIKEGRDLYINKKSDLFAFQQATIAIGANKSHKKYTKISDTTKKNGLNGLKLKQLGTLVIETNTAQPSENVIIESPTTVHRSNVETERTEQPDTTTKPTDKPTTKNKFVQGISEAKMTAVNSESFNLNGAFSEFLGSLEKKPTHSVVITIDAPPGSGKTRSVFQFLNMAANGGYDCIFASLEEHPASKLFTSKADEYIEQKNESLINVLGELPPTYQEFLDILKQHTVIAIDSWNKVFETYKVDFDTDLRKALDGKLIIAIFQRTQNGKMRGGSKAAFDGDIILEVVQGETYRESFLQARKNRYQHIPLNEIGYNFYHQQVINPAHELETEYPATMTF